jgi:hypothetical protein
MRRCRRQQPRSTWTPLRPPSRGLRRRSRRASRRSSCRRPAWRTCACRRPRCAPWAAGARGASRSRAARRLRTEHQPWPALAGHLLCLKPWHAAPMQVPRPVRRDGGGPAAAAVLRLRHRALLLPGMPEGGLARGPQRRVPAPASAAAGVEHATATVRTGRWRGVQVEMRDRLG